MSKASAAELKSLVNRQQSAKYYYQLHLDFFASVHSDFFKGQTYSGLFCWPSHSGKLSRPKQKKKVYKNVHCFMYSKIVLTLVKFFCVKMSTILHHNYATPTCLSQLGQCKIKDLLT